jgi:NAD(P)-dependent dehydrogenase (short-subunit alcohol dehydrogenase family)
MRLKDKVVIVTGSTTGIGEATARRFVAEGARVVVHGRDRARGEKIVAELGGATKATLCVDDLADPATAPRMVGCAVRAFGKLHGIVNNAAWIVRSDIHSTDAELFDRCMAVNVRAPLLLFKAAFDELKRNEGSVLNIGSINGLCGEANQLAYSVSKGALITLSRNLADAHGRDKIRVNHFNVGWVLSPNEYELKVKEGLPRDWPDHPPAAFAPSGKLMTPETIATAAVYWIGDESRPVSGSVLEVEQYPAIGRNPLKEQG